ncbi:MAG: ArnT family glycosyltransferase [Candidatus Helarchaeales archaeon]
MSSKEAFFNFIETNKITFIISIIIVISNILIMLPMLSTPLIFDTNIFILYFKNGIPLSEFIGFSHYYYYQRPFGFILIYTCYTLFYTNPLGWRTVSLLLSLADCFLLYFVSNKLLRNQTLAAVTVIIFLLFTPFLAEVYYWCACYFYFLFSFFMLCAFYCFACYKFEGKHFAWFCGTVIFSFLAVLSNELATFAFPAFVLCELLTSEKLISFFKRDIWKYFLFTPIIMYLVISFSGYTGDVHPLNPSPADMIPITILLAVYLPCLLPLAYGLRKYIKNPAVSLVVLAAYFTFAGWFFQQGYRLLFFPTISFSIFLASLFDRRTYARPRNWHPDFFTKQFWMTKSKARTVSAILLICSIIPVSLSIYGVTLQAHHSRVMGSSSYFIAEQIIASGVQSNMSIYLLNLNMYPDLVAIGGDIIRHLEIETGKVYNITIRYLSDTSPPRPADLSYMVFPSLTEAEFNTISLDPNNVVFLCQLNFIIYNVSGLTYTQLQQAYDWP